MKNMDEIHRLLKGWLMQLSGYIFLTRHWETDQHRLMSSLSYITQNYGEKIHLLIFLEGTDFNNKKKVRLDAYAEAKGLPKYDYVLHPKTTGFCFITEFLRKEKSLDAIYDITIGYPDLIPEKDMDMIQGKLPKEVHMHIQIIPESDVTDNEEDLKNWLNRRWFDKEKRLEEFYKNKRFSDECWPELRIGLRYFAAAFYLSIISVTYTFFILSPAFKMMVLSEWIFFVGLSLSKYNLTDLEIAYYQFWKKNVVDKFFM